MDKKNYKFRFVVSSSEFITSNGIQPSGLDDREARGVLLENFSAKGVHGF